MSSKSKQKASKKQKPKNTSTNTSLPFDGSAINNNRCGRHQQQQMYAMASRNNPEMDGVYPPLQNFTMRSTPAEPSPYRLNGRPHTAHSRLPYYAGNGHPHGYVPPYQGYHAPHPPYVPLAYDCHRPMQQPCGPYGHDYYGPAYSRSHRNTPSPNFVPYDVKLQQAFHKCQMSSAYSHRSAPVSARTTPSNSMPGTPHDVNRRKDFSFLKSSCSTPNKFSRQPSIQTSSSASISSKSRKFESYLPLCEVQKAMKKGDVIEGVLRINPRNYEDAYISAPDGAMDIYIGGIVDRNRSMNGDRVAVRINPMNEWRILFDTIRLHWNEWSEHLLKCVNEPNTSRNSHNNSVNLSANTANLAAIPEHSRLSNANNDTSPDTARAEQDAKIHSSGAVNRSTFQLQSQSLKSQFATTEPNVSLALPESFNAANIASHESVVCNATSENVVSQNQSKKSSKKRSRRKRVKRKQLSAGNNADSGSPVMELNDSDSVRSNDDLNDSPIVSETKMCNAKPQGSEDVVFAEMACYTLDMSKESKLSEVISQPQSILKVNGEPFQRKHDAVIIPSASKLSVADKCIDVCSNEDKSSDILDDQCTLNGAMEDVAFIEEETVVDNNFENTSSIQKSEAVEFVEPIDETVVVGNNESLEAMIKKLNSMAIISSGSKKTENSKSKSKKKKAKKLKDETKKVTIVTDAKNFKVKAKPKVKNTFGLPDAILSINVLDLLKLPFGSQCVQKTGKVVHILESNHPRVAGGKLKLAADKNMNFALFSPIDSKVPRMMIDKSQCPPDFFHHPDHYSQTLFLAKIDEWPDSSTFPKGKMIKTLGDIGDINAETEMILIENSIDDTEYDEKSCKEFFDLLDKNGEFRISEKESDGRKSFKEQCVFTIDPSTARDLDDALSVRVLDETADNGRQLYEVGVHIADVTHFLKPGSVVDTTARDRTTSTYLVQRVIPMLPRILCEKLCSLNPGEEKLTFSVVWKMDIEGNAYQEWFGRTVIESCVKLSYELAQDMIDNPDKEWSTESLPKIYGDWSVEDISSRVNILMTIARNMRKKRFYDGALCLDAMKFSFVLDPETGLPVGFTPENRRESNFLVEEFMLGANMAVAHRIYKRFPELSFLRCHPSPDSKLLKEFLEFCENANLKTDDTSPEDFKKSVTKLVSGDSLNAKVISYYFLRSLTMAQYFCSGMSSSKEAFRHYALNVPLYTHFTSPIRRYADVIVHRLLAAALDYDPEIKDDAQDLHRLAKRCNDMKMAAANASEQSSKLFINLYLKTVGPMTEKGVVSQVLDHAFDVIIPKFGHMARIYIESLDVKSFQYRTQGKRHYLELIWNKVDEANAHQVISAFSVVSLRISVYDNDLTKWNVVLLPNK